VLSLRTKEWQILERTVPGHTPAHFAESGRLIYAQSNGGLVAVPFDPDRREVSGSAVPLLERIDMRRGGSPLALSGGGTLVHLPARTELPGRALVLVDRDGRSALVTATRGPYLHPRLSRDGSRAAAADQTTERLLLRGEVLDQWLAHSWDDGVRPDQLESLELLRVQTRNSSYDLAILSGCRGHVLVRGGRYFPEWTPVYFLGCSPGGALLKRHSLHTGLRMEFAWDGRRVITSPVCSIGSIPVPRPSAAF